MKTNLFLLVALLATTTLVQAQHGNIGIKGGLNAYNIAGENSGGNNYKNGINVGLLSHFHMGEQFALQPEIYFSGQGTSYKVNGNNVDLNLNYVNIPVVFQYMFDNGFRLEAGPQLGLLASAKTKIGNSDVDVKDNFKSTDIGLALGMSYVKPATGFGFNFRYNHGLTDINETIGSEKFNRGFQVGLFYLFEHKS
jgi:hypothetical protein